MSRYVYDFSEGSAEMRSLLGGKGANLAEMTSIGLPVPGGFTVTTEACLACLANDGRHPDGLDAELDAHLAALEQRVGKRLGARNDPLLVSVRSGAAFSMPGMMDTILNLGINDQSVQGLAEAGGDQRFAYDSYRRFVQMYGDVVAGVDGHLFENALGHMKMARSAAADVDLSADDMRALVAEFLDIYRHEAGEQFPQDPRAQLQRSIDAVFASWNTPRARTYRREYHIADDLGTAVNVVQMVFGNMGDDSATGVCFTRNPSTGERERYGEFLVNAQGEDVVAGIRTPQPLAEMGALMADAYRQLGEQMDTLEQHYGDMQDIEFTVERGTLYILQTRAGKRTAAAAVRVARDMVDEGVIDRRTALLRVDPAQLDQLLHPAIDPAAPRQVLDPRPQRLAGRGRRGRRVRCGHGRGAGQGRAAGDPGAVGDDPGRHPRRAAGAGRAHGPRRYDVARSGGRASDGEALRGRSGAPADRPRGANVQRRRHGRVARATRSRSTAPPAR